MSMEERIIFGTLRLVIAATPVVILIELWRGLT